MVCKHESWPHSSSMASPTPSYTFLGFYQASHFWQCGVIGKLRILFVEKWVASSCFWCQDEACTWPLLTWATSEDMLISFPSGQPITIPSPAQTLAYSWEPWSWWAAKRWSHIRKLAIKYECSKSPQVRLSICLSSKTNYLIRHMEPYHPEPNWRVQSHTPNSFQQEWWFVPENKTFTSLSPGTALNGPREDTSRWDDGLTWRNLWAKRRSWQTKTLSRQKHHPNKQKLPENFYPKTWHLL